MGSRSSRGPWSAIGGATNKSDIVQALTNLAGPGGTLSPREAVDGAFEMISMSVACGETVSVRNFGKFEPRKRSAVTRKNPKTGVPVEVPEKLSVGFVPAPALKSRLNQAS